MQIVGLFEPFQSIYDWKWWNAKSIKSIRKNVYKVILLLNRGSALQFFKWSVISIYWYQYANFFCWQSLNQKIHAERQIRAISQDDEDAFEREKQERESILSENVNQLKFDLKKSHETAYTLQQEVERLSELKISNGIIDKIKSAAKVKSKLLTFICAELFLT